MKAFPQITFRWEYRLVWSYSASLLIIGLFIMFKPVFAQHDETPEPELKIDVNKHFDESGSLIGIDSIRTWIWSGTELSARAFDSIWKDANKDWNDFFPRRFDRNDQISKNFGLPLHNFWYWNSEDSSAYSYFEDLFDEDYVNRFRNEIVFPGHFDQWFQTPSDSLGSDFPDQDKIYQYYNDQFMDFQDRLEGYRKEQLELFEKYFRAPGLIEDTDPPAELERLISKPQRNGDNRSGEI